MTINERAGDWIQAARKARACRELGKLDYIRAVTAALQEGATQREVAAELDVAQPAISKLISAGTARGIAPVREGFSGAGPYEIAQRYAADHIPWAQMIAELCAWPYSEDTALAASEAEWDATPYPATEGSFAEVERALLDGLIDERAYDIVFDRPDGSELPEGLIPEHEPVERAGREDERRSAHNRTSINFLEGLHFENFTVHHRSVDDSLLEIEDDPLASVARTAPTRRRSR